LGGRETRRDKEGRTTKKDEETHEERQGSVYIERREERGERREPERGDD
jgi:hypothetical protein